MSEARKAQLARLAAKQKQRQAQAASAKKEESTAGSGGGNSDEASAAAEEKAEKEPLQLPEWLLSPTVELAAANHFCAFLKCCC